MKSTEITFQNARCTKVLHSKTFTGPNAAKEAQAWCQAAIASHASLYRAEGSESVTVFGANAQSMVTDGGDEAEAAFSFNWDDETAPTVAELRVRDI